jgi:hypothetical protein
MNARHTSFRRFESATSSRVARVAPSLLWAFLALTGCFEPSSVTCDDGRICPSSTRCDTMNHRCVTPAQDAACMGKMEGASCAVMNTPGTCSAGACQTHYCGDGIRSEAEACDGSDLGGQTCTTLNFYGQTTGLACKTDCTLDTSGCEGTCGDGKVNGPEACDGAPPQGKSCLDFGFDQGIVGCSALCGVVTDQCSSFGWKALPSPMAPDLTGVWASSANDVFVVAPGAPMAMATVHHWDGANWSEMPTGAQGSLYAIWGSAPDDIFAVGGSDIGTAPIVHFDGTKWTATKSGMVGTLHGVWGSGPRDVFAVNSLNGAVVHWNGTDWSDVTPAGAQPLWAVWGSGSDDVLVAGVQIEHWNGASWSSEAYAPDTSPTSRPFKTFNGLGGSGPNDVFAVGGTSIEHFDGSQWSPIVWGNSLDDTLNAVWVAGQDDAFVVGNGSSTFAGFAKRWNGSTWTNISIPKVQRLNSIWGVDGGVFAVGEGGAALHWAGTAWSALASLTPAQAGAASVWSASPDDAMAVGTFGAMHWDGKAWSAALGSPALNSVWGLGPDDVYAAGTSGLFHWDGHNWTDAAIGAGLSILEGVWASPSGDVFAVGDAGLIARRHLGVWSQTTLVNGEQDFLSVWGSGPADVYAVGPNNIGDQTVVHWDGQSWNSVFSTGFPGTSLYCAWGSGPNDVYAVGAMGTIVHWDGKTWRSMISGTAEDLISVSGSGPGDVFVASQRLLLHLREGVWETVALPSDAVVGGNQFAGATPKPGGLSVSGKRLFVVGGTNETHLDRDSITCKGPERDCTDGWDNDCDGLVDGSDPDCKGKVAEQCANLVDDDGDGKVDCADPDCATFPSCKNGVRP